MGGVNVSFRPANTIPVASEQEGFQHQRAKKDMHVVVNQKIQRWASVVLQGDEKLVTEDRGYDKKEPGFFKSTFHYIRFEFTSYNFNFDNRSRSERKQDAALLYGLIGMIVGAAGFFFWLADYQKINHRIATVNKGEKDLKTREDGQAKTALNTRFVAAKEMLQIQKSRLQYKLAVSGGLMGFSATLITGSLMASSALITLGTLGLISTAVGFTAHTAYTWKQMKFCKPEGSIANIFPLNWVSKKEIKAAKAVFE